ncbi:hypothetical protein [Mesorhizobium sp. Cs1299R1N3]|uniref:hypothetical protein n=1 Tax=Mesorhizobium sp. Cs1299R1N3 TaxID=3015173 RepID=UPI00301DD6F5
MTVTPQNDTPSDKGPGDEGDGFRGVTNPSKGFDDGRKLWEWRTRYPDEAQGLIHKEACIAGGYLVVFLVLTFICAGFAGKSFQINVGISAFYNLDINLLAVFFTGALGGTTFSIKWLMHSVATGKWHVDRFYWRVFVPLVGGVYAVIVLNLLAGGLIGGGMQRENASAGTTCALAFLVGYFSDGVSGLLTNVANAVFGTVEKK